MEAQAKQRPMPDVVRARGFEVVDARGNVRVDIDMGPVGEPWLVLRDNSGKRRATLELIMGDPMLTLSDAKFERARLSSYSSGRWGLDFSDATGRYRAGLGIEPDGMPTMELRDVAGTSRASLEIASDGMPSAVLGATSLEMGRPGETRTRLESSLVLFDKGGKLVWQAP